MRKSSTRSGLLALSLFLVLGTAPAQGQASGYEKYLQTGQKAYDQGQFRNAGTSWLKALKLIETANQPTVLASTLTKLAQAFNAQGKLADANEYVQRALAIYQGLGGVSPDFATAFGEISKVCRNINLDTLGEASSRTLKANSAKMVISKAGSGASVQIDVPARFESNVGSDKIDQLALEKLVTFDVNKDSSGTTTVSNIKGFKIHSVEKGMWVNLLNLVIRQQEADGKYDAEITAGKAGIEKVVPSRLPDKVVFPVSAIVQSLDAMSTPVALPLPVVASLAAQPAEAAPATPATTTPVTTTPETTTPVAPTIPDASTHADPAPRASDLKPAEVIIQPKPESKPEPQAKPESPVSSEPEARPEPVKADPPAASKSKSKNDKDKDDDDDDDDKDKKDKKDKDDKDGKDD